MDDRISADILISAYCQGAFPMADSRQAASVQFYIPQDRAIVPLSTFRCSRSLRQTARHQRWTITQDQAFAEVIDGCRQPRTGEPETWINSLIRTSYLRLHELGVAHSVEAWVEGQLVGGLYGLAIGGAFFGESMFHRPERGGRDASKVCLVHLVDHLVKRRFTLLDAQINSDHMRRLGAIDVPHEAFMEQLRRAIRSVVRW